MDKKLKIAIPLLVISVILYYILNFSEMCGVAWQGVAWKICPIIYWLWPLISLIGAIYIGIIFSQPILLSKIGTSMIAVSILFSLYFIPLAGEGHPPVGILYFILLGPLLILGLILSAIGNHIYKKRAS